MKQLLFTLSLFFIVVSCVKDIDTKQYEEAFYSISFQLPLIKEDLNQNDFLDNTNTIKTFSKIYLTGLESVFDKNEKDSIHYSITISTSFLDRPVHCLFKYEDANHNPLPIDHAFKVPINANNHTETIIYEGLDYQYFVRARYVKMSLEMGSSNELVPPPLSGNFNMQSVLGFKLEGMYLAPPNPNE